ncbi:AraC family transcriptional regulator [Robiginitalea sp. SC105]|uniref:helix-turn-helix domain-containing protein n=1 Tax=Robiginitalea sp. SC105 TaxID=2762332 RepID=UPI001639CE76|nr:helix-turn-helix transcriptional regulator [Robiginitalea sp. SC105]MBC2839303.1 helix-turn-helix transcriptional regulator [Robiginitalea sp. SC105]
MQIESHLPEPALRHLLKEYYYFSSGEQATSRFVPVIDDCCYDFIFFRERESTLVWGGKPSRIPVPYKVFTIHQLRPPYQIRFGDSLTFFTVKAQPWANAHFFGRLGKPGVADLLPVYPRLEGLYASLMEAPSPEVCFGLADNFFRDTADALSPGAQMARQLCQAIAESEGRITVKELSESFERSRQYLGKVFRQEVLYSLKYFILTVRMMGLVKFRIKNPEVSMTELCYRFGYFDQPHFNRDFKRICGVTPTRFFGNLPEFLLRH